MVEYISKTAVVAEIERIKKEECPTDSYEGRCKLLWFEQFLSFINTLKVKEVDLEKEIANQYESNYEEYLTYEEFADIAKHFFELGINTRKI